MEYKIIRSNRKTIGIYIIKDGSILVRCPKGVSDGEIERLVNLKADWINKKVAERKRAISQKIELDLRRELLFMGRLYPVAESDRAYFDGERFYIPKQNFRQNIEAVYKALAKDIITKRVMYFSKAMELEPSNIKISRAKTRWGSCSGKNSLNFAWRLVMAEEKVIDYVVIHELAHIREHNHGRKFWDIVERFMPDYKLQQGRLRDLENWIWE